MAAASQQLEERAEQLAVLKSSLDEQAAEVAARQRALDEREAQLAAARVASQELEARNTALVRSRNVELGKMQDVKQALNASRAQVRGREGGARVGGWVGGGYGCAAAGPPSCLLGGPPTGWVVAGVP